MTEKKTVKQQCGGWRLTAAASLILCLLLHNQDSLAADLSVHPAVTATEYYTDNVFLTSNRSSDLVTEFTPSVSASAKGARTDANATYQMQNMIYADNSSYNKIRHQLSSDITSEIVNDKLYVDGFASFSQRQNSIIGVLDPNRIAPSDNLANVINYGVEPRYNQRLSPDTNAELRYKISETQYTADSHSDYNTTNQNISARLAKNNQADDLNWNLRYHYTVADKIGGSNTVFQKTDAEATYDLTARITALATAGYEKNRYETVSAGNNIEDSLWSLGMRWALSKRTSVRVTYGHRFFGDTRSLDLRHSTRLTSLSMNYAEDLTTGSILQAAIPVFDENGNLVLSLEDPTISSQVYLNKKLSARFTAHTGKTQLTLAANHTKRLGQSVPDGENIYSATGSVSWRIAPRTSLEGSGHLLYRNPYATPETIKQGDVSIGINRTIQDTITASLSYNYLKRVTYHSPLDYTRNLVMAKIRAVF